MNFINTVKSEWLKQKRSTASWLIVSGALFIPTILLAARFVHAAHLPVVYQDSKFWEKLWNMAWESVTLIVLPIIIMLLTSLIVQIEYRNNAWKQVHATPQSLPAIFFAKLLVILTLVLSFFLVLNIAIYLVAVVPMLFFRNIPYPLTPIPFRLFATENLDYFIDTLPIIALQYLLSLHFKNFMVPLGIGMAQWLVVIGCISWKYLYIIPYAYTGLDFEMMHTHRITAHPPASLQILAVSYFVAITAVSLVVYTTRKDRG